MSFRSVAEFLALEGDDAPTTAETRLIEAVKAGLPCYLCDPKNPSRPAEAADENYIRASLLRFLIIGGTPDCALHERGVFLIGGWVEGVVDLAYCRVRGQTAFHHCRFSDKPRFECTRFQLLSLQYSFLPGLFAQGARVKESVSLHSVTVTGPVVVVGAKLGGQFTCEHARFDGGKDAEGYPLRALMAQGLETGQSVFLRGVIARGNVDLNGAKIGGQLDCTGARFDGGADTVGNTQESLNAQSVQIAENFVLSEVTATGTVAVLGARIGGQLDCTGARFDGGKDAEGIPKWALNAQGVECGHGLLLVEFNATGPVVVVGAKIGGQFACEGAQFDCGTIANGVPHWAIEAQRMRVAEGFIFRKLTGVKGLIGLAAAHVGDLVDDAASWPLGKDSLILDGLVYDRLAGTAPTTFAARRDWLKAGSHWHGEFRPQPYTQFARVLRQMGHAGEARQVLIERERLLAEHRIADDRVAYDKALHGDQTQRGDAGRIWLRMTGFRLWTWLTKTIAGYGYAPQRALYCSLTVVPLFALAYAHFWQMGAMVPADAILLATPDWADAVVANPSAPSHAWAGPAASHYETFYSLPYALDVFLPIVDLGQQSTWSQTTVTWWGWAARLTTWALQTLGYIITSLGLAAATGIIQRNQPD